MLLKKTETGYGVNGELTFDNAVFVENEGKKIISHFPKKNKQCVIDLEKMKEQNAACLSVMLSWIRAAKQHHVSIVFIHLPLSLKHMIEVFGLSALLPTQ